MEITQLIRSLDSLNKQPAKPAFVFANPNGTFSIRSAPTIYTVIRKDGAPMTAEDANIIDRCGWAYIGHVYSVIVYSTREEAEAALSNLPIDNNHYLGL